MLCVFKGLLLGCMLKLPAVCCVFRHCTKSSRKASSWNGQNSWEWGFRVVWEITYFCFPSGQVKCYVSSWRCRRIGPQKMSSCLRVRQQTTQFHRSMEYKSSLAQNDGGCVRPSSLEMVFYSLFSLWLLIRDLCSPSLSEASPSFYFGIKDMKRAIWCFREVGKKC